MGDYNDLDKLNDLAKATAMEHLKLYKMVIVFLFTCLMFSMSINLAVWYGDKSKTITIETEDIKQSSVNNSVR